MSQIKSIEDCISAEEISGYLEHIGYKNVWVEEVDQHVVIHGISIGHNAGGEEVIIPEAWNRR